MPEKFTLELNSEQIELLGQIALNNGESITTYEDLEPTLQKLFNELFAAMQLIRHLAKKPNP